MAPRDRVRVGAVAMGAYIWSRPPPAQLRMIEAPPSTNDAVPVTKEESSKARSALSGQSLLRPLGRKQFHRRPANATARTRYDGDLILQTSHGGTP
jgi:hypothetical protein